MKIETRVTVDVDMTGEKPASLPELFAVLNYCVGQMTVHEIKNWLTNGKFAEHVERARKLS